MAKILKIGIVGCGRIFSKHLDAINKNLNLKIIAICDTDKKKLNKIKISEIFKYDNLDKMLEMHQFDLVSICTPSGLHPIHALACIKKGNNVLIEKPLGTDLKNVKRIFNINKEYNKKIFLVKQNRFNPTIVHLNKLIKNKLIKNIFYVQIDVIWSRGYDYYKSDKWRGTKELDGGALLNQASHYVDLMMWLFGKPVKTLSFRSRRKANIEMEDTFSSVIILNNNIHCSFNATTTAYKKNLEGSIKICAENCTLKVGGQALNKIEFIETNNQKIKSLIDTEYEISDIYGKGHIKLYEEIQKSINGIRNNAIHAEDGIESLNWILEQYKKKIYAPKS